MIYPVTPAHIAAGKRRHSRNCPVALATGMTVGYGWIGDSGRSFPMSPGLAEWVRKFDNMEPVYPITITIQEGFAVLV